MMIGIDIRALIGSQLSGVGLYLYNSLKSLFEVDNQNQYKLFFNSANYQPSDLINDFTHYPNVKLYSFKYPNKLFNALLIFLHKPNLDEMVGYCDVFWFPNLNFWQLSKKCRSVITVHDLSFKRIPWAYSKKMRLWHKLVYPREKFNQADKIISVSENTKSDLVNLYNLSNDKIDVVYPGIQPPTSNLQLSTLKLPEKYILYLGTLEPRKNVESVIKAFEALNQSDLYLVIAGQKGWLYKNIYRKVQSSKLQANIKFLDYVSQNDRFNLYKNAQVLVWPSYYEGFGFPPLEAMSLGCPVITSANSSLPEVVGEASLLVDPFNANEIKEAINQVINDDGLYKSLIQKGYEQVKKYDWQKSGNQLKKLFENLK